MATYFAWKIANPNAPPLDAFDIEPSDSTDITTAMPNGDTVTGVRAFRAKSAGTVKVTTALGNERELEVAAGELIVLCITRVHASGTTVNSDSAGSGIEGYV